MTILYASRSVRGVYKAVLVKLMRRYAFLFDCNYVHCFLAMACLYEILPFLLNYANTTCGIVKLIKVFNEGSFCDMFQVYANQSHHFIHVSLVFLYHVLLVCRCFGRVN